MPHEAISYLLKSKDLKKRLQFQLVLQCAPFLKKFRNVCIITIERELGEELEEFSKETHISYAVLSEAGNKWLVLFYRREELEVYLDQPEVIAFLKDYGYTMCSVREVLLVLQKRMKSYFGEEQQFPHELGVILGYPIEDVRGFIKYKGKNCLTSGYWKVYSNLQNARKTFKLYDHAKAWAMNEFIAGKPIEEIICA